MPYRAIFGTSIWSFQLLNSVGILLITQAALVLQPTHTARQKRTGTLIHATLANTGVLALIAGLVVIYYNKSAHNGAHFQSAHARLGLATFVLIALQAIVGITQYFTPAVYGGVDNAKKLYKFHRAGGYITTTIAIATICAATWTDYNLNVLHIKHWTVILSSVVFLAGIVARIKKEKFGFWAENSRPQERCESSREISPV